MLKIGLTGGIGSGKSTVADLFSHYGFETVDADEIARFIVEPNQPALAELIRAFGEDIINSDHSLNRAALAKIAFANPEMTDILNGITHPRIAVETARRFKDAERRNLEAIIFDMPLLVDNDYHQDMDLVIVVEANVAERIRRLQTYRGISEKDARSRIQAQISDEVRRAAADFIIDNNGSPQDLESQVLEATTRIRQLSSSNNGEGDK